ncbi:MAG: lipopolysaccharide biosynthesis protein [Acidobacteriota bacterium]
MRHSPFLRLTQWVGASAYRVDLLANYLWAFVAGMLGLFLMPVYARLLGFDQWGGVALGVLIQSILAVLDAGLSQTMPRDIAAARQGQDRPGYAAYLAAYVCLAGLAIVIGVLVMPLLSRGWVSDLSLRKMSGDIVVLAASQFAVQMCNAANMGYWSGRQQQALAVRRSLVFTALKHALALSVVLWVDASAQSYFLAMLAVSVVELILNARVVYRSESQPMRLTSAGVLAVFQSSRGVTFGVLLGMGVTQLDRLYFSRDFSAAQFGVYTMILSLGLAFMQLQYPLMQANMPRVVSDTDLRLPGRMLRHVLIVCGIPSVVALVSADWLIGMWLGADAVPAYAVPMFRMLVVACLINAIYHVYYQYMVASNAALWLSFINGVSFCFACILLAALGDKGGMMGGVVWMAVSSVQLLVGWQWFQSFRRRQGRSA